MTKHSGIIIIIAICGFFRLSTGSPVVKQELQQLATSWQATLNEVISSGGGIGSVIDFSCLESAAEKLASKHGVAAIPFLRAKAVAKFDVEHKLALLTLVKLSCPESVDAVSQLHENVGGHTLLAISYMPAPTARMVLEQAARKTKKERLYGLKYTGLLAIVGDSNTLSLLEDIKKKVAKIEDVSVLDRVYLDKGDDGDIDVEKAELQYSLNILKHRLHLSPEKERDWTQQELNFWRATVEEHPDYRNGMHLEEIGAAHRKRGIRYTVDFLRSKMHASDPTKRSSRPGASTTVWACSIDLLALVMSHGKEEFLPDLKKYLADNTLKGAFARRACASIGTEDAIRILEATIAPEKPKTEVNLDIVTLLERIGDGKTLALLSRLSTDEMYSKEERDRSLDNWHSLRQRLLKKDHHEQDR